MRTYICACINLTAFSFLDENIAPYIATLYKRCLYTVKILYFLHGKRTKKMPLYHVNLFV